jgi:hypothetical protein
MALTAAEVRSVFEVLEVPYSTAYNTLSGVGSLSVGTDVASAGQNSAKAVIETACAALDASGLTKVSALVVEWDACRLNVGEMQGGGVADANGISFSFEGKRQQIKRLMQVYLPFFRHHEVIAAANGNAPYRMIIR